MPFVGPLEPLKCLVFLFESGVNYGKVVGWDIALLRFFFQMARRLPGRVRVAGCGISETKK